MLGDRLPLVEGDVSDISPLGEGEGEASALFREVDEGDVSCSCAGEGLQIVALGDVLSRTPGVGGEGEALVSTSASVSDGVGLCTAVPGGKTPLPVDGDDALDTGEGEAPGSLCPADEGELDPSGPNDGAELCGATLGIPSLLDEGDAERTVDGERIGTGDGAPDSLATTAPESTETSSLGTAAMLAIVETNCAPEVPTLIDCIRLSTASLSLPAASKRMR